MVLSLSEFPAHDRDRKQVEDAESASNATSASNETASNAAGRGSSAAESLLCCDVHKATQGIPCRVLLKYLTCAKVAECR